MDTFDESVTIRTTPFALCRALEVGSGVTDINLREDDEARHAVNQLLHLLHVETYHEDGGVTLQIRCVKAILNFSGPNVTLTLRGRSTGDVTFSDYRRKCAQRLTEATRALQKQVNEPSSL